VKILIFEWILLLEIQTNCKNWVSKEKSVELSMCLHLGNGIHVTTWLSIGVFSFQIWTYRSRHPCGRHLKIATFCYNKSHNRENIFLEGFSLNFYWQKLQNFCHNKNHSLQFGEAGGENKKLVVYFLLFYNNNKKVLSSRQPSFWFYEQF
jgi:hypothetical protein